MENNEVKLNDIIKDTEINSLDSLKKKEEVKEEIQEISTDEIKKELGVEEEKPHSYMDDIFDKVNAKIEKDTEKAVEIVEEGLSNMNEEEIKRIIKPLKKDTIFDDEEEDDDFQYEDEEVIQERMEQVKKQIKDKLNVINNKIDLNSFKVSKKPISVYKAFKQTELKSTKYTADWYLPETDIVLTMEEFQGLEIINLNPSNSSSNRKNTFKKIYKNIYDHIITPGKPPFEEFLKLIRFDDIPHLYFNIIRSSFNKKNSMPYECPNTSCKETFIEDIPIDEMVKFDSDEVKDNFFAKLEEGGETFNVKEFEIDRVQISDEYVIDFRQPSVFNVLFENLALPEKFTEANTDIISAIAFIEDIYFIDLENHELRSIKYKVDSESFSKTIMNKVIQYGKVINSFNSDQYFKFAAIMRDIEPDLNIRYVFLEEKLMLPKLWKWVTELLLCY